MAFNHETGQREQKTVTQTFKRQVDHLRILEVETEDGTTQTIKTTNEHPFWSTAANDYVEAKSLKPGTKLEGANGHYITVKSSRYEPHPEGITVYNVEVKGPHNYFVAANGYRGSPVLAHNTCGDSVSRALTPEDLSNFNAGKRILPKGIGGSIEDQVQGYPGRCQSVISPRGPPKPVYNLEVQVKHTYYVADTGVLVHNGAPCKSDEIALGLGPKKNYQNFADETGGLPFWKWKKNKLTQFNAENNGVFDLAFDEASKNAKHIHFNLDRFKVLAAVKDSKD